jgi:hypothetical protein
MALRFARLLLCVILLSSPALPFVRPAPRPPAPKGLTSDEMRRLLRMQKRNREMDRIMAKRAKSG